MYSFDAVGNGDGTTDLLWTRATNGRVNSSPAIDPTSNLVFVGSEDKFVYALNFDDGDIVWKFLTRGAIKKSSPAVADSKVFIGSDDSSEEDNNQPGISNPQTEYFNIGGREVLHSFNSIADGLQMPNPQTYVAQFLDVAYMESTALEPWNEQLPLNLKANPLFGHCPMNYLILH